MKKVVVGGVYEHYKGSKYEVVGLAKHSETMEDLVIYKALYGEGDLWARPKEMFLGDVMVDEIKVPRFKLVQ